MIGRIWHGWTNPDDADRYEHLLREEIFPEIAAREIDGYIGIQLLRRPLEEEVEFITMMWFESWDAVKQFAGEDYQRAYVPAKAQTLLTRFDEHSQHYEMKEHCKYQ